MENSHVFFCVWRQRGEDIDLFLAGLNSYSPQQLISNIADVIQWRKGGTKPCLGTLRRAAVGALAHPHGDLSF